jgi:hypothetical protein
VQELLGIVEPTAEELPSFDELRLSEFAEDLNRRLRTRGEAIRNKAAIFSPEEKTQRCNVRTKLF